MFFGKNINLKYVIWSKKSHHSLFGKIEVIIVVVFHVEH